ncbi:IS3 family transposase [Clostridium sp.]
MYYYNDKKLKGLSPVQYRV